jgi:hypothetical protein
MLLAVIGDVRCSLVGDNFGWQDVILIISSSSEERAAIFVVACTNSSLWHRSVSPSDPAGAWQTVRYGVFVILSNYGLYSVEG